MLAQALPLSLSLLAGSVASLSDADSAVVPFARVAAVVPFHPHDMAPRLHVSALLTGLPGETVSLGDARTFHALEFSVGISQRPYRALALALYAEAGFASRLPGDPQPRDRAPRWAAGGFRIDLPKGSLAIGVGADQRLDGNYRPALTFTGGVQIAKPLKVPMYLVGSAILGIRLYDDPRDQSHDVVRVGVAVGGPR